MTDEFETYIVNAIRWAQAQLGSDAYPFRCLAFVEDAYERATRVEIFGGSTATESAEAYGARSNNLSRGMTPSIFDTLASATVCHVARRKL